MSSLTNKNTIISRLSRFSRGILSGKLILLSLLIVSVLKLNAQYTWMERLSYNYLPDAQYYYHDSVCGLKDAALATDGNYYLLAKTSQQGEESLFKISPNGGAFLWSAQVGYHWTLNADEAGVLRATTDSGCILIINHLHWSFLYHVDASIEKYSSTGVLQWSRYFYADASTDFKIGYDIIQNAAGNYYALIADSLFEIDGSGNVMSGTDAVSGTQLCQLWDGDLLVRTNNNSIVKTDLSGNTSWTYSPVNATDLVALPPSNMPWYFYSSLAVCVPGSQLTSIDASGGNALWTVPISITSVSSIDIGSYGEILLAEGLPVYALSQNSMSGSLTRYWSTGAVMWSKQYTFPHYGLSLVRDLGPIVIGGTYTSCDNTYMADDYSAFVAIVDSTNGDTPLETASDISPGDADMNDTIDFATDAVFVGIAFGSSGPVRDHENFPGRILAPFDYQMDYGFDWSQSFGNGINYKHADYNGDGIIDSLDFDYPIWYGPVALSCKESGAEQTNLLPDFMLIPQSSAVLPGDTMRFYVVAGSAATPVSSLYDIASVLSLDYSLIDYSFGNVIAYSSDFGTPGIDMLKYSNTSLLTSNVMSILFSRTDHNNVSQLHDTLGVIELISSPDVSIATVFNLNISGFGAATYNASSVEFNTIGASVTIDPNATSVQGVRNDLEVYPNPVSKNLTVKTFLPGEKTFQIIDIPGRKLKSFQSSASVVHIPIKDLENGTYFLMVSSGETENVSKFIVEH